MSSSIVLYSYWRSSCSYRVRIALNLKKLAYNYQPINLLKGEQKSEEFTKKNPSQAVPALEIDGHLLTESMAILEYLEETIPEYPLLPKDPYLRAKVRELSLKLVAGTQPIQNLSILNKLSEDFGATQEQKTKWAFDRISKSFNEFETILSQTYGKYCVGDQITMADICLIPQIYNSRRFGVDVEKNYPIISKIEKECMKLECFKKADPAVQPDAQPA